MFKIENMRINSFATTTGAESGRSAGFSGIIGDLDERNNNNLA